MKRHYIRIIALLCVFSLMSTSVFAYTNASDQLSSYEARVRHLGDGELEVFVSVFATNDMDTLGASNIIIYHKVGSVWVACESVGSSYPGMTTRDSLIHEDYVYISVIENAYLKVEVVIYAEDYSGASDSRVLTYYVYT